MIIKGKGRTNGGQLGAYLGDYLNAEKNERVEILEIRGCAFPDLNRSLASWEAEAQRSRCKKALWHAQIAPVPGEKLTREQQLASVDILEKHLGLNGQPRAVVVHQKDGHEHIHVAWSRIRRETVTIRLPDGKESVQKAGRAIRDNFSHRRNVNAAREIEERFDLRRVESPTFRSDDKSKTRQERREESKAAPNARDFQRGKRSGIDPRQRKQTITDCWQKTETGVGFRQSLQAEGYILAHGQRRDFVVVDKAGDIHSLARQVKGAKAADIRHRLRDIDPASIPKAVHIQQQLRAAARERGGVKDRKPTRSNRPTSSQEMPTDPPSFNEPEGEKKLNPLDPAAILEALTKQQSTFTKADLEREVLERLEKAGKPFGHDAADDLAASVRQHKDFIALGADRVDRPRFTSRDMLETELMMRDTSDKLAARHLHDVRRKLKETAPSAARLTPEQRTAFHHVTKDEALSLVVGYAGTGKSTMLGAAREAWEAAGYRVRGASLSSMAASSLEKGSGIKSRTLASTLWRMKNVGKDEGRLADMNRHIDAVSGDDERARLRRAKMKAERDRTAASIAEAKLTKRDIVVLDEAAMVGSRQMTTLLTEAEKAGAKVVLVGDAEQLQAIDAGGAFRALRDRHGAVEITEIRRQKEDWQRQATKHFAQSYTDDALGAYSARGHVRQRSTQSEARNEMVDAWTAARQEHPEKTQLMMAFTRHDVNELNKAARKAYRDEGRLGTADTHIETSQGGREFSKGDRIYFLKNDLRLGVMNGSLGTLEKVEVGRFDKDRARMTVALDTGKKVTFTNDVYNHFTHGYAATVHKAQGATVDRAHLLASQHMDRHSAYVGMSRHRERTDLYFGNDEFRDFRGLVSTLSRDHRKDTTLDYLQRAETSGEPKQFWAQFRRIISPNAPAASKEELRQRASDALMEALNLRKRPKAERMAARDAAAAASRLREVLGARPDKRRGHSPV